MREGYKMNRKEKEAVVSNFKEMFMSTQASFLVCYKGLKVKDIHSLRKNLRERGGSMKITKARLMKIAAEGIDGIEPFVDSFKDQVGLIFASQEAPAVAKQIVDFSKENKNLQIVSGFFESKVLSTKDVEMLASIPSREVLLAQLASVLQAPVANLAQDLQMLIVQLLYALKGVAENKGEG